MTQGLSKSTVELLMVEKHLLRLPQAEMPVTNDFCHGLYARTIHLPAGTFLTGAIHKDESFFVLRHGILRVTNDVMGVIEIGPGYMGITAAGEKRAGYAVTDVVFTTFHANPREVREEKGLWEEFTVEPPPLELEGME